MDTVNTANLTPTRTEYFRVDGIVCYSCAGIIENAAASVPGVVSASVNYIADSLRLEAAPDTDLAVVAAALKKRGYRINRISERAALKNDHGDTRRMRAVIAVSFVLSLFLVRYPFIIGINPWVRLIAATAIQIIAGRQFMREALPAAASGTANMSSLVSLGTFAAYAYSVVSVVRGEGEIFFDASGSVLVLVMIGKYLERGARITSAESVRKLIDSAPRDAVLITPDGERTVPTSEIVTGDVMLVRRGEFFPADGIVISGRSAADESGLTGESRLVKKEPGDRVYGAAINTAGKLEVRADRDYGDGVYAKMLRALLSNIDGKKAEIQREADRVCAWFVPAVLAAAVVTLIVWYGFLDPGNLARALKNAVAGLIVACPCALGIATPMAVTMSAGMLGKSGIFVKNPAALELLAKVDTVVFDKTGTLTLGADDRLRAGAPRTVETLKRMGIRVILLSGDTAERAETAASAAGIGEYRAGLLPEDKSAVIAELRKKHVVAMVGDGVNDALSIASADVGIAIGRAAEVSLECADAVITRNRVTHVLKAVYAGRVMMKNIRRGLRWALAYNIIGLLLAVCGVLSPVVAGTAMALSSLCVVLNARSLEKAFGKVTFERVAES